MVNLLKCIAHLSVVSIPEEKCKSATVEREALHWETVTHPWAGHTLLRQYAFVVLNFVIISFVTIAFVFVNFVDINFVEINFVDINFVEINFVDINFVVVNFECTKN